jgi:peptidoglycan/xylan/chitin deacetylase (PgdA/CDA1 family)
MLRSHGRYPYSAIVRRPVYEWPNGTRLAVYVAVNVEQFPFGEGMGPELNPKQPEPDIVNFTWRDWGNRVGVWRLIELLDEMRIPASVALNSAIYDHCPEVAAGFRGRGDEMIAHGRTNAERQAEMGEAVERAMIREVTEKLAAMEGKPPRGWLGPFVNETHVTPDLLQEAGYGYLLDWAMDDQPVWLKTRAGRILSVPYSRPTGDLPMMHRAHAAPSVWAATVIDAFDEMLAQSARQPVVFNLSLHPYLIGQPARLPQLRRVLAHIVDRQRRIWLCRAGDIAAHAAKLPEGTVP